MAHTFVPECSLLGCAPKTVVASTALSFVAPPDSKRAPRWAILIAIALLAGPWTKVAAQDSVPTDLNKSIESLSKALEALTDDQKKKIRTDSSFDKAITSLQKQIDATRQTDADRTVVAIQDLTKLLTSGRFTVEQREALATGADLKALETALTNFNARRLHVHIISASYGDHRTNRTCDATPFFTTSCSGIAKCPLDAEIPTGYTGAVVCGYEPAPLAREGANYVKVTYACGQSAKKTLNLQGKNKIICAPGP